jgi:hypothetical protein
MLRLGDRLLMQWQRIDPVQTVGALLAIGVDAVAEAEAQLAQKSELFQQITQVRGQDWLAYFGTTISLDDGGNFLALPNITAMRPLYEEVPGWWLPVGTAMSVAEILRPDLRLALCAKKLIKPPFILVPRFGPAENVSSVADVYELA